MQQKLVQLALQSAYQQCGNYFWHLGINQEFAAPH